MASLKKRAGVEQSRRWTVDCVNLVGIKVKEFPGVVPCVWFEMRSQGKGSAGTLNPGVRSGGAFFFFLPVDDVEREVTVLRWYHRLGGRWVPG